MDLRLQNAFISGYERLVPYADLLDRINVFPVPDADTGTNLKISLAPLKQFDGDRSHLISKLLSSATGNSGNIAAGFFSGFLYMDTLDDVSSAAAAGRDKARQAVREPKPGTMLTVFDELADAIEAEPGLKEEDAVSGLMNRLQKAVSATFEQLPELKHAEVVDAGALGMFIYLEGFFKSLIHPFNHFLSVADIFKGRLRIAPSYHPESVTGYCVDSLIRIKNRPDAVAEEIAGWAKDSLVTLPDRNYLKVHLHTKDWKAAQKRLRSLGEIIRWSEEPIDRTGQDTANQTTGCLIPPSSPGRTYEPAMHIMTDAAGTVTRGLARKLGMTLLDSYIIFNDDAIPETLCRPGEIYSLMRKGVKVSTAQASVFERSQSYQSALEQNERVLYLCVGSVYTGNHDAVTEWKKSHDPEDRLKVIDSGAASGRLGTVAIAAAAYAAREDREDLVIRFADKAVCDCREYIFPERLEYLVAGGRLSRTKGFIGDLLHMKPVISPTAQGAVKIGVVRDRDEQLDFALEGLQKSIGRNSDALIMLEYSDNQTWVNEVVEKEIRKIYPHADTLVLPLSLTSGVHMGPGAWAVAFLPGYKHDGPKD